MDQRPVLGLVPEAVRQQAGILCIDRMSGANVMGGELTTDELRAKRNRQFNQAQTVEGLVDSYCGELSHLLGRLYQICGASDADG